MISDDIYEEASGSISALGLDTECLGGGRIEHFPDKKFLKVYGYSQVCIVFDSRILLLPFSEVISRLGVEGFFCYCSGLYADSDSICLRKVI